MENKIPTGPYWRVQLLCKKVQAYTSLEPPLEYNQDEVTGILHIFKFVLEGKSAKDKPGSLIWEFLKKFSAKKFILIDPDDNTSEQLNRESIADFSLRRALLAIHQKSREPRFLKVIDSLVSLA